MLALLAGETGLPRLGTVPVDGTKIDANASKVRSVRSNRACELRTGLAADSAQLTAQAEATNTEGLDPRALPAELARREALKAKLDAACRKPGPNAAMRPNSAAQINPIER